MIRLRCPKCKSLNVVKVFCTYGWEYKCRACKFIDEYEYFAEVVKNVETN